MLSLLPRLAPALLPILLFLRIRAIVRQFTEAGALGPDQARRPDAIGVSRRVAFRILARHAVLAPAGDGRFYLDTAAYDRWRRRRNRILAIGLVVVVLVALALAGRASGESVA